MNARTNITQSAGEALDLLQRTRKRLITEGRNTAVALLRSNGNQGITGAEVFAEMKRREVKGLEDVKAYWLPAVFRDPCFVVVSDTLSEGLGHDKLSHSWRLTPFALDS